MERECLLCLRASTDGANWKNKQGWEIDEDDLRNWHGVTTTNTGTVSKVVLPDNQLSGEKACKPSTKAIARNGCRATCFTKLEHGRTRKRHANDREEGLCAPAGLVQTAFIHSFHDQHSIAACIPHVWLVACLEVKVNELLKILTNMKGRITVCLLHCSLHRDYPQRVGGAL